MISKDYVIVAPNGIHARPATKLIKLTKQFKSQISLKKGEKAVRLNSMLNILAFAAKGGDSITVIIEGEDENEASIAIDEFFTEQLHQF